MKKFILFISLLSFQTIAFGQKIQISMDFENAEQTLKLLTAKEITEEQVKALHNLHSTKQLIKKIRSNDSLFYTVWSKIQQKQPFTSAERRYQYPMIQANAAETEAFLNQLKINQGKMIDTLNQKLSVYIPDGKNMNVKVVFLLGGDSMGFTMGDDSTLYIGLQQYKGDAVSVLNTCLHELFHNIQQVAYDTKPMEDKLKKESDQQFYYLLTAMFKEGTANYISDLTKLDYKNNPHVKELLMNYKANYNRSTDNFYLFDHLLVDLIKNPKANLSTTYSILFDWNWNNPAYYIGQMMTEALVKEYGEHKLKEYLSKDPVYFIKDYINLPKNKKKVDYKFSDEFENEVNMLLKEVKQ